MSTNPDSTSSDEPTRSAIQIFLLCTAVLGLLTVSVLAPGLPGIFPQDTFGEGDGNGTGTQTASAQNTSNQTETISGTPTPSNSSNSGENNTHSTPTPTPPPTPTTPTEENNESTQNNSTTTPISPEQYTFELDSDPTPGQNLTVRVTARDTPVSGLIVKFNDKVIGETNVFGEVTGTVPYTEDLNITAQPSTSSSPTQNVNPPSTAVQAPSGAYARLPDPQFQTNETTESNQTSKTYSVSSNISITFPDRIQPGEETTVNATIGGYPMSNANVTFNDRVVGKTNDTGELTFTIPSDSPNPSNITVSRGEFSATETVPLAKIDLEITSPTPIGLPGQEVKVTVTSNGKPLEGVSVFHNGDKVGETNTNGTLTTTHPIKWESTIQVQSGGQTASQTTSVGMNTVGVVSVVSILSALVLYYLRKRGVTLSRLRNALHSLRTILSEGLVSFLVATTDWFRGIGAYLHTLSKNLYHSLSQAPTVIRHWIQSVQPIQELNNTKQWVASKWASVIQWVKKHISQQDSNQSTATSSTSKTESLPSTQQQIRDAWQTLADESTNSDWTTKTPGEIARNAQNLEFPDKPVDTLTTLFREIEYGDTTATNTDAETATTAAEDLSEPPSQSDSE